MREQKNDNPARVVLISRCEFNNEVLSVLFMFLLF